MKCYPCEKCESMIMDPSEIPPKIKQKILEQLKEKIKYFSE